MDYPVTHFQCVQHTENEVSKDGTIIRYKFNGMEGKWFNIYSWENGTKMAHLKCVCNEWKKAIIHLSSKMNGVDVELPLLPRPDFAAPDRSNSRKHGKPLRYGSNWGPLKILLSAKNTCNWRCNAFHIMNIEFWGKHIKKKKKNWKRKTHLCTSHF